MGRMARSIADLVLAELAREGERVRVAFEHAASFHWRKARDALDAAVVGSPTGASDKARSYLLGLEDGRAIDRDARGERGDTGEADNG